MRVMSIANTNKAYPSNLNSSNIKSYFTVDEGAPQPPKDKVSFQRLPFFPKKVYTEEQVITVLRGKKHGLFVNRGNGFVQANDSLFGLFDFNIPGVKAYIFKSRVPDNKPRTGITLQHVRDALGGTSEKVTAVVDDGLEVLKLPGDKADRINASGWIDLSLSLIQDYNKTRSFEYVQNVVYDQFTKGFEIDKKPF